MLEDIGSVIYDASSIEGQLIKSGFTEGYLNFPFVTLSLDDIKHQRYRTEKLGIIVQGKNRKIAGVEQLPSSTSVLFTSKTSASFAYMRNRSLLSAMPITIPLPAI